LDDSAQALAAEMAVRSGWSLESEEGVVALNVGKPSGWGIVEMTRTPLVGDIVHYAFVLSLGSGEFDRIGLHRVVRESRTCRPIRTRRAVMLQHGDAVGFEGVFLHGSVANSVPDDHAFAVFLAQNDYDVWGIDQRWILVPAGTSDLAFMSDWNIQRQVDDLGVALSIARIARLLTGGGGGQFHLIGYSSGVFTGFAYLNQETERSPGSRHVKGFVPIDSPVKTSNPQFQATACAVASQYATDLSNGIYAGTAGTLFATLGGLALSDPGGLSPVVPGLTNEQAALVFGAATHQFIPYLPWYHYAGGQFGGNGLPTGLLFTPVSAFFEFLISASPYEALRFQQEVAALVCGSDDLPYDDHFAEIAVPVFYVGTRGGFDTVGTYVMELIGSEDKNTLVVSLLPPEAQMADFGHVDCWTASDAEVVVWQPILGWLDAHPDPGRGGHYADAH